MANSEAFILLTLTNVTLRSRQASFSRNGTLTVQSVTIPPQVQAVLGRSIFLVLRIGEVEIPLDPRRAVTLTTSAPPTYKLHSTDTDSEELELLITNNDEEDVDTFEGILAGYCQFSDLSAPNSSLVEDAPEDVRGHLVLVNEESGEIVGQVDKRIHVHEDSALARSEGPVVIEIPQDEDGKAIEVFARNIPPQEQDWMTKSAKMVSQGISLSTNMLVNVISSASSSYIARSSPSPSPSRPSSVASGSSQSKAVAFISSPHTQGGLKHAHALSAQAVKLSGKTLAVIDDMISKIIGGANQPKVNSRDSLPPPYSATPSPSINVKPPLPPRTASSSQLLSSGQLSKPPLSPRSDKSFTSPVAAPPLPPRSLTTTAKLVLSADLILSTFDESLKQLVDVGGRSATRVVNHHYGGDAAKSTSMLASTAKNAVLVYIDTKGIGRKAIIKRVGKQYIKTRLGKQKEE